MKKEIYKTRRQELVKRLKEKNPTVSKFTILLIGAFEDSHSRFVQESSFYYYTGIIEPGAFIIIDQDAHTTVYIPTYKEPRSKWVEGALEVGESAHVKECCVEAIESLGASCTGYSATPLFTFSEASALIKRLEAAVAKKESVFTTVSSNAHSYVFQKLILERLGVFVAGLKEHCVDVSPLIAAMRRKKSNNEIEELYRAIRITMLAQEAAAYALAPDTTEANIQAAIEFIFTQHNATQAFPSIVAAGKNGTILHYTRNNDRIKAGDLIVIDIGARFNYYCADLTRTYPVTGKFTARQQELYDVVLETQEFIASIASAGYWLNNASKPDQSLNHIAREFLKEKGYDQYFTHGIGHYLGLDVHDVGDYSEPLAEGDVITIEPGLYISGESTGIRIEDNYWIVPEGAVCLSEELYRTAESVEEVVQDKPNFEE